MQRITTGMIAALACAVSLHAQEVVVPGPGIDDQASVIRSTDDGARMVVFERLDEDSLSGDLWLTRSLDDGATWSEPVAIIASVSNERHPALLQLGPHDYVLFYLKGAGSSTSFRLWRATSTDGISFAEQNQLDLGWTSGGEVNPHVILHADGTLTMSYQRLPMDSAGSYVAESTDGGATWDTQKSQIASNALLPRLAYRESDGLYLASYQVNPGNEALKMYTKTTTDPHDWSAPPHDFEVTGNNHDSLPVVMPDDAFVLFWSRGSAPPLGQFDIAVRRSLNGIDWSPALTVTESPTMLDVEPHPLLGASTSRVELYWGREPLDAFDYDIVREPSVVVNDMIFADAFEAIGIGRLSR